MSSFKKLRMGGYNGPHHLSPAPHPAEWGPMDSALVGREVLPDGSSLPVEIPGQRCQFKGCRRFLSGNPASGLSEIDLQWGE